MSLALRSARVQRARDSLAPPRAVLSLRGARWAWAAVAYALWMCATDHYKRGRAPVPWRDVAGSKVGAATPIAMAWDVARVAALYRLGVWPLPPDDGSAAAADDDGYEEITGET